MTTTWQTGDLPAEVRVGPLGWVRVVRRGVPLALVVFGGLALLLTLRLVERPVFGPRRPVTPWITQGVCRMALMLIGLSCHTEGRPMRHKGAVVSNHVSWLDIFVLNAAQKIYFVAKSEVAAWPLIGWLARATGTLFIRRDAREAKVQKTLFEARLDSDHRLLFFPEGTSTDGQRVLTFKPTLFQAFFAPGLHETVWIQPVTLVYHAPAGCDGRFYGWWGEMEFAPHLFKTLAARKNGGVTVTYHAPLAAVDFSDRKALARACEAAVRSGLPV